MVTLDVKYVLACLVFVALLILLIFLCIVAAKLITTVKNLNTILEDASVVSSAAADTAEQVDGIVSRVGVTASRVKSFTDDSSVLGAVSNVARAVNAVVGRGEKEKKETAKQRRRSR